MKKSSLNIRLNKAIKYTASAFLACALLAAGSIVFEGGAPAFGSSIFGSITAYAVAESTSSVIGYDRTSKSLSSANADGSVVSGADSADAFVFTETDPQSLTRYTYSPVSTEKTDSSSRFGAGRLTMYANHDSEAQHLSVIIETGDPGSGVIVVDGGWAENGASLLEAIKSKGGHVGAWLITHPHQDHALALADILKNHASEITIDGIYYSLLDDAFYKKYDTESVGVLSELRAGFANIPADRLHGDIKAGQIINVGPAKIQVLNEPFKFKTNTGNNSCVVYDVSLNGTNTLFLGDLALAGGSALMSCLDLRSLNCDLVQVAHHGQEAVSYSFYQQLAPRAMLWATPKWLWDNDNGGGPGSGKWTTGTTRKWADGLLIRENYVTKDGDIVIE
ncbi:MAG: MBL fold metallo-hydrolase [Eubacteriales bacterium]|nr:MBL fold metallo-hydrolase [Eubacteriales bacterium]